MQNEVKNAKNELIEKILASINKLSSGPGKCVHCD